MNPDIPEKYVRPREKTAWDIPAVRFLIGVRRPDVCDPLSNLCGVSYRQLKDQIAIVGAFIGLCDKSMALIRTTSPTLLPLLKCIVLQYLRAVCSTCLEALKRATSAMVNPAVPEPMQDQLDIVAVRHREMLSLLNTELEADEYCGHGWIAMTIYELVYYALADWATRHGITLDTGFIEKLTLEQPLVGKWLSATKGFAPSTLCYDLPSCVVGTTYAHWHGWEPLERWEKEVRRCRIRPDVRAACCEMQATVHDVARSNPASPKAALIRLAQHRIANDALFAPEEVCGPWWSADGATLRHKDQCPTCQVWFRRVELQVENQLEHRDRLGEKRDEATPWQCAEVDLLALLFDFGYASAGRG